MRCILAFFIVFLVLSGCATPTAYQPQGRSGGYTETQLDKNVFRVSFKGNGFTHADRVEDFALLRSAELTLQNGFTHFVIVDGRSGVDYSSMVMPTQTVTTGTVTNTGNTAYLNAQSTTMGGQSLLVRKPSTSNTIICFNGKPEINALVYDAQFVFDSISKKYGMANASK